MQRARAGVNYLDTAHGYGESEIKCGKALKVGGQVRRLDEEPVLERPDVDGWRKWPRSLPGWMSTTSTTT